MDVQPAVRTPFAGRVADVAVVLLLAPILVPVAAVVALLVLVDSPGPVLFRHQRVGLGGRTFTMLKFRTMRPDLPGPPISADGDPRYTPLGRWLARSRLDELPQLWNVLRGDMRFVGPRPEVPQFVGAFADEYREILRVAPGLTGPTQVEYAWEGEVLAQAEEHDREAMYRHHILPMKVLIDLDHVRNHSGWRDVLVLVRTLLLPLRQLSLAAGLVRPRGATPRAQAAAAVALTAALPALVVLLVIDGIAG